MTPTQPGARPGEAVGARRPPAPPELDWVTVLRSEDPQQPAAVHELHQLMLRAARHQVWRLRGMLPGRGAEFLEELAHTAADEAVVSVLAKLDTFEGRSRFTTWAYKFAILQAATEVRRQAWTGREVALLDLDERPDPRDDPAGYAEAADLASAVRRAMTEVLTPYQRKVALALLVDEVPIDVLADRLSTTRGALYKALHDVRGRLRQHLQSTGLLEPDASGGPR